jgi:HK97 family phage major capsid protein
MSERYADLLQAVKETVHEYKENIKVMVDGPIKDLEALKKENAENRERLEMIEAARSSPGKTAGPGAAGRPTAYKVHVLDGQHVYELPSTCKMVDAIPDQRSEVGLDRWLAASLLGEKCRDRQAVEFAREIEAKTLTGGTTGVQIPEQFISQWIDNLRANLILNAAGMTTITMTERTQTHSRVLTDPTVAWRAEAGALTATDPTFELRTLTAKSVYTRVKGSVELAADSPDFGQQLMNVMSRAMAAEIDRAGLRGSGASNEPTGIVNVSGINSVTGGAQTNYDDFVDAVFELSNDNVPEDRIGPFAVSPATMKVLRKLKTGIASDQTTLTPPPGLPRFLVSKALDNNSSPPASTAVVGDWADLLFGVKREASVETLKLQSYADNLLLEYVAWARVDFLVRRPVSFTKITGINN